MAIEIDIIRSTRKSFIREFQNLSIEEINSIPEGFNNNIVWNFGHMIAVQQGLCCGLSGLTMPLDMSFVGKYRKGSRPEFFVDNTEFEILKNLSVELIDIFENDVAQGIFKEYRPLMTALEFEINSFEKAVKFNCFHEGLHLGYSMALKKAIAAKPSVIPAQFI
jgi:hypothetical protein